MSVLRIENFLESYYRNIYQLLSDADPSSIERASEIIMTSKVAGRTTFIFGNGGSAAIASHVSVDLVKAAGVRASNFNEADLLTCFSNDYGYERWVEKCVEFYCEPGDTVVLISSSGRSPNIINGAVASKKIGANLITLSGFSPDNPLRNLGDVNLYAKSDNYNHVETVHQVWLLSIVDFIIAKGFA